VLGLAHPAGVARLKWDKAFGLDLNGWLCIDMMEKTTIDYRY
jgi:hypothetical protein